MKNVSTQVNFNPWSLVAGKVVSSSLLPHEKHLTKKVEDRVIAGVMFGEELNELLAPLKAHFILGVLECEL